MNHLSIALPVNSKLCERQNWNLQTANIRNNWQTNYGYLDYFGMVYYRHCLTFYVYNCIALYTSRICAKQIYLYISEYCCQFVVQSGCSVGWGLLLFFFAHTKCMEVVKHAKCLCVRAWAVCGCRLIYWIIWYCMEYWILSYIIHILELFNYNVYLIKTRFEQSLGVLYFMLCHIHTAHI